MRIIITIALFITFISFCSAQKSKADIEAGIGIEYNYQTKGFAPELRAEISIIKNLSITPRLSYYPGFNTIHELYLGLDADYHYPYKKVSFYALLGLYYDHWVNSDNFSAKVAKRSNVNYDAGIGIEWNRGCLNPFFEHRYSIKWKEGTSVLGIKWNFSKCGFGGRGGGGGSGWCPAYGNKKRR